MSLRILATICMILLSTAVSATGQPVLTMTAGDQAGVGETVDLRLSISSGASMGMQADWWLVEAGPEGLRSFDLGQGQFVDGLAPTFQGPLFDFNDLALPITIDTPGDHAYFFGVDMTANGTYLEGEDLFFDGVVVSVSPSGPGPGTAEMVRVYVAGESIEVMNSFAHPPFNEDGTLNDLGPGENNTDDEFGWMVPFAERLRLRDPGLSVEWVGAECWSDWNWECTSGSYPADGAMARTSAIAGTTIQEWLEQRRDELQDRTHCYDVAFASRGGNDLYSDVSEADFRGSLRELVLLLDQGSSCRKHPLIYVTGHMIDITGGVKPTADHEVTAWLDTQRSYYVETPRGLVEELAAMNPALRVRFIDMWTPFVEDWQTTAFPNETWWTTVNGVYAPDIEKIDREGYWSGQHPGRLASIFAGENAADQIDLAALRSMLGE